MYRIQADGANLNLAQNAWPYTREIKRIFNSSKCRKVRGEEKMKSEFSGKKIRKYRIRKCWCANNKSKIKLLAESKCVSDEKSFKAAENSVTVDDVVDGVSQCRIVRANDREFNEQFGYADNYIKTSKYNIFTFLPLNLCEQFRRLANFYFLVLMCLQFIPLISSVVWYSTAIPLIFVLFVSAVKDGYDDVQRHKNDNQVNNRVSYVVRNGRLEEEQWMNVKVGDIVRMENEHLITADLLLLSSSEPYGLCYIETAELDGETNLKCRCALAETSEMGDIVADISAFNGEIHCEPPNNRLHEFEGRLIYKSREFALDNCRMLLRGCRLRNTRWCYGLVIFAGRDTKLMMNSGKTTIKQTSLDRFLNVLILGIVLFLFAMCFICMILSFAWERVTGKNFTIYLEWDSALYKSGPRNDFQISMIAFLQFFSYIILLNTVVPISLYISVEVLRFCHSLWINFDRKMYYEKTDTPAQARTTTLNEELGQVQYIFSDKTGTLTQNIMVFKKCSINGRFYGNLLNEKSEIIEIDENTPSIDFSSNRWHEPNFFFYDKSLFDDTKIGVAEVHEFWRLLAICHTVMPERKSGNQLEYQAQSPDEAALTSAARNFGFVFKSRTPRSITIEVNGKQEIYEVLHILDFNNIRKRMSVIVRAIDRGENEYKPKKDAAIKLYCKGADTVIFERLCSTNTSELLKNATIQHLDKFASDGLRTLCLAYKLIEPDYCKKWIERQRQANLDHNNKSRLLNELYEEIEKDMILLGATAIEDKLQDGVPQTISTLADANIKIWVLTGDKTETAINIGYSCRLLTEEMREVFVIDGDTEREVEVQMKDIRRRIKKTSSNRLNSTEKTSNASEFGMSFDKNKTKSFHQEQSYESKPATELWSEKFHELHCKSKKQQKSTLEQRKSFFVGCIFLGIQSIFIFLSRRLRRLGYYWQRVFKRNRRGFPGIEEKDEDEKNNNYGNSRFYRRDRSPAAVKRYIVEQIQMLRQIEEEERLAEIRGEAEADNESEIKRETDEAVKGDFIEMFTVEEIDGEQDQDDKDSRNLAKIEKIKNMNELMLEPQKSEEIFALSEPHSTKRLKLILPQADGWAREAPQSPLTPINPKTATITPINSPIIAKPSYASKSRRRSVFDEEIRQPQLESMNRELSVKSREKIMNHTQNSYASKHPEKRTITIISEIENGYSENGSVENDEYNGFVSYNSPMMSSQQTAQSDSFALVINGSSLVHALAKTHEKLFLEIACLCISVICCRVTPLQKAKVVDLVKRHVKAATLAIGDGANDVSMIKTAHIGVGISGQDGMQAVLASDFSIGQFRYLERLLLVHGRWSYFRMSKFLRYFFYKNFSYTLVHFWYSFFCGYSAQTIFDPMLMACFNMFFTALPVLALGVFDQDVNDEYSLRYPQLYIPGQNNMFFNMRIFIYSVLHGGITSIVVFFVPYGMSNWNIDQYGRDVSDYTLLSFTVFTALVVVVNGQIIFDTAYWTIYNHLCLWGSLFLYVLITIVIYEVLPLLPINLATDSVIASYGVVFRAISYPNFWLTILLVCVILLVPVLANRFFWFDTRPSYADRLRVLYKLHPNEKRPRKDERAGTAQSKQSKARTTTSRRGSLRSGYAFSHSAGFGELISRGTLFRNLEHLQMPSFKHDSIKDSKKSAKPKKVKTPKSLLENGESSMDSLVPIKSNSILSSLKNSIQYAKTTTTFPAKRRRKSQTQLKQQNQEKEPQLKFSSPVSDSETQLSSIRSDPKMVRPRNKLETMSKEQKESRKWEEHKLQRQVQDQQQNFDADEHYTLDAADLKQRLEAMDENLEMDNSNGVLKNVPEKSTKDHQNLHYPLQQKRHQLASLSLTPCLADKHCILVNLDSDPFPTDWQLKVGNTEIRDLDCPPHSSELALGSRLPYTTKLSVTAASDRFEITSRSSNQSFGATNNENEKTSAPARRTIYDKSPQYMLKTKQNGTLNFENKMETESRLRSQFESSSIKKTDWIESHNRIVNRARLPSYNSFMMERQNQVQTPTSFVNERSNKLRAKSSDPKFSNRNEENRIDRDVSGTNFSRNTIIGSGNDRMISNRTSSSNDEQLDSNAMGYDGPYSDTISYDYNKPHSLIFRGQKIQPVSNSLRNGPIKGHQTTTMRFSSAPRTHQQQQKQRYA